MTQALRGVAIGVGLCFAIGGVPSAAGALPGDLDLQTYVQIGGQEPAEYASDIVLQPDGKIVTGGGTGTQTDFVVVRQMPGGLLDSTFDGDGKVRTDFGGVQRIHGLVVQSNGRIVGAGTTGGSTGSGDFALARYRSDDSLDVSFGGDGFVTTDFGGNETGWDIALQQDGKLVVVGGSPGGASDFLLARYNPDGSLDDTFGDDGHVNDDFGATEHAFAVVVQSDGRIVAAGSGGSQNFVLARYNSDGSFDESFAGDGVAHVDFGGVEQAMDLAIQSDDKILAVGLTFHPGTGARDFAIARLSPDGSLDTQGLDPFMDAPFGTGGKVTTDFGGQEDAAQAVAVEPSGRFVVAGWGSPVDAVSDPSDSHSPATTSTETSTPGSASAGRC